MKKKNLLITVIVVAVIAVTMVAAVATIANNLPKINLVLEVPNDKINENEEFSVSLRISNEDVEDFLMAGIQIEIPYDTSALSVVTIKNTSNSILADAESYDHNGVIKYVSVKKTFSDTSGFEVLDDIFEVTFKAKKNIDVPSDLFDEETISVTLGDTLNKLINRYSLTIFRTGAPTAGITNYVGKSGDTFELYVYANSLMEATQITLTNLNYDKTALKLTKGEWIHENASVTNFSEVGITSASFNPAANIDGNIIKLSFEILEGASNGAYSISYVASAKCGGTTVNLQFVNGTVIVNNVLKGDVDGNNMVDSDDAIHLLYNVLFGEESYPLNQNSDFDGNGIVDSDDAIHLLYNVLFGSDSYPLK